jgi:Protein of unknown function (DUF2946)
MPWSPAMRASIGMKWLRSNIKHGSRLALFALALQFALSFGHFHGGAAQAAPAVQSGSTNSLSAADTASEDARQQPASNHDSDQQQGDVCAICAVLALANAMLFATPPLLLLPQAIEILYLSTGAEFAHLNSAHVAFQPRAPPVS